MNSLFFLVRARSACPFFIHRSTPRTNCRIRLYSDLYRRKMPNIRGFKNTKPYDVIPVLTVFLVVYYPHTHTVFLFGFSCVSRMPYP